MDEIQHHFWVRDMTNSMDYYLGNNLTQRGDKIHISTKKHANEVLRKYQDKYGTIVKANLPIKAKLHSEVDDSPFLNDEEQKEYQHIVGVCQWLIISGHFDFTHAVSSLSRFACAPRKEHLSMTRRLFGYLKNYPKQGYAINPNPLKVDIKYTKVEIKQ
eukprot:6660624-Ditylum_brightwellii.AAC.1